MKAHVHKLKDDDIRSLLKGKNLSITAPRIEILRLLINEHGPFTAEQIYQKLPKNFCDKASIYRSLIQFEEKELVLSSHLEKEVVHYEYNNPEHHHHHIICRICHKVETIHDCAIEKIERTLEKLGYTELKHRLEMFGTCSKCSKLK